MIMENNAISLSKHQRSIIKAFIDVTNTINFEELVYTRDNYIDDMVERLGTTPKLYQKWLKKYGYTDNTVFYNAIKEYVCYYENKLTKYYGLAEVFVWL